MLPERRRNDNGGNMTDDTKTDETDAPIAAGPDHTWWQNTNPVDAAEREKRAVEAKNYHDERTARYYESAGAVQIGGFAGQNASPFARPRNIDWTRMPRLWDWR